MSTANGPGAPADLPALQAAWAMADFVLREGLLLVLLFFTVAALVAWLQQGFGHRLSAALHRTGLGAGTALAAGAGAITPFCSCSTVPVLAGMLQARLRLGVCFAFLIASPVINEGVLLVLLRHQHLGLALLFLAAAFLLSMGFGALVDRLGLARHLKPLPPPADLGGAMAVGALAGVHGPWPRLAQAGRSAAAELRRSAPYLALGIAVGAAIHGWVPQQAFIGLQQSLPAWLLVPAMALLGVPVYVNASLIVPIAVALLDKGLGVGPVAAFLVSAAGTSIPEMVLLARLFRPWLIFWHVLAIVASAAVVGWLLQLAAPIL